MKSYDYGQYEEFYSDPRTQKVLADVDALAKRMKIDYAIIGGIAAYLHVQNPPEDYPDIDVLIYNPAPDAIRFVKKLTRKEKYHVKFVDIDEGDDRPGMVFAAIVYDKDIQLDVFTSYDESTARKTIRRNGVELEMIEPLIVGKLIRGTDEDIRSALDLLAFVDYDKRLLSQLGRECRVTGLLEQAAYWARRMAAGRLSKNGIVSVVARLSK